MDFSAKLGIPAAVGLTVMFTSLVLASGFFISVGAGIVSAIFTFVVAKTFFSH